VKIPLDVVPISRHLQLRDFPRRRQCLYVYWFGVDFFPLICLGALCFKVLASKTSFGNEFSSWTAKMSLHSFALNLPNDHLHLYSHERVHTHSWSSCPPLFWYYRLLLYPTSVFYFSTCEVFVSLGFLLWKPFLQRMLAPTSSAFFRSKSLPGTVRWELPVMLRTLGTPSTGVFTCKVFSSFLVTCDVYEKICPTVASQPHQWDIWEPANVPTAAATTGVGAYVCWDISLCREFVVMKDWEKKS